jgi:hypothetical protein
MAKIVTKTIPASSAILKNVIIVPLNTSSNAEKIGRNTNTVIHEHKKKVHYIFKILG